MGMPQKLINKFLNIFEGLTGFVTEISSDHAYIHKGLAQTAIIEVGTISTPYHIAFKTPTTEDGKYIHWRPEGLTSSANYVGVTMKREATYTLTGGSAVTPINRNENSDTTTTMQAFSKGVTNAGTGTLVDITGVGTAGTPTARSGGAGGADHELVLSPDTNYVITLTPAAATTCTLKLFWYEEDWYIAT
jgi:hypothetical protein